MMPHMAFELLNFPKTRQGKVSFLLIGRYDALLAKVTIMLVYLEKVCRHNGLKTTSLGLLGTSARVWTDVAS